jgi:O-antigen/teichoic acid export membrane protein
MFFGVSRSVIIRLSWTALSYGTGQSLRLLNNVILARLLAPQIFGLMALVNAIRVGVELMSDVGINQNIVTNPRGAEPQFYNTAWTLQALRGISLAVISILLAVPLSRFFHYPQLAQILPVAALFFVFTGFDSTARGLLQKKLQVSRLAAAEIGIAVVMLAAHVSAALILRNVWALVLGSVITGSATLIVSFLLIPGMRNRFMIDPGTAREMMKFGKWVFLSSIVYFFAMNFDRLYFAKQITLSQLGVYGIARGLADMISLFVMRSSSFVLYPAVAASGLAPVDLRRRLLRGRRTLLLAAAVALGTFLAVSDLIVGILYDPRYSGAGAILPILCFGVWFGILTSTNDSILMGLARPAYPAISNGTKLATYLIGVPIAFQYFGFTAAVMVIAGGEFVKYATLWVLTHKEHLRFGRDDLVLTLMFAITAIVMRELVVALGLTGTGGASGFHDILRSMVH